MLGFVKFWTGFGILVPFIALFGLCIGQAIIEAIFGDDYYSENQWARFAASWVPSLPLWLIGSALYRTSSRSTREEQAQEPYQRGHDTFLFVQFRHWAILAPVLYLSLELLISIDLGPVEIDKPNKPASSSPNSLQVD